MDCDKVKIIKKCKSENMNKATKLWTKCFSDYLEEKSLPGLDDITNDDLPRILENFYAEVCKKNPENDDQMDKQDNNDNTTADSHCKTHYKNTTLKSIHSTLCRYYKQSRSIDIIKNEQFIRANSIFQGVQQINKEKGFGDIKSIPPINDSDLAKVMAYFRNAMDGPPNAKNLQESHLLHIILHM